MKTYKFKIYGHEYETRVIRRDDNEIVISVNGNEYKAYLEPTKRQQITQPTPKVVRPPAVPGEGTKVTAKPSEVKGARVVKAPLPGLILKVVANPGSTVKVGDPLLIMEAMKMQNTISATMDGQIEKILVKEGESILEGHELAIISTVS